MSSNRIKQQSHGEIQIGADLVKAGHWVSLGEGDSVTFKAIKNAGVLILAGQPIDEPVAHYGPFVMNSMEEINQAIADYQNGVLTD
ncbi:hypothetical protein AT251_22200 [Enterovibrio nigricans]|uniref:Pirin C-terminal cupin domain-containing protein n=1 Tax=Enterovibrio nigricans DSM 22720 TaxID=1121868 RepID=A0A1T4VS26_9GAMM|nr:pirin-like C-terminal cupin domain-containing protein [Enterovibrio nigricans]PKF48981.1 hypothetical protein AT251_22200 [Enterovibrio nigricans]SKA67729.1 Pirin C-terminal cupin domain-containing protein [Enterovibrio nigricans DSM 22720]